MAQVETYTQADLDRLEQVLAASMHSTEIFSKLMFPERFYRKFGSIHKEFFRLLDDDTNQFTALAAPRGWGKTSLDTISFPARRICFEQVRFVVVVSCTRDLAAQNVKNLARELTGNENIQELIGDLKGETWAEGSGRIETSTGIVVLARGAGQQIRGLLERGFRPDLIIVDDLEDAEAYRLGDAEAYMRNLKEWFYADLIGAIDRKRTRVVVVGTILHADSLLANLLEDPDWVSLRMELCDDNYISNFPDFMTSEEVATLAEGFARRGQLDVFYREYRNLPIAREDAVFTQDLFKHWTNETLGERFLDKVVIVDPAKTVKIHSDYTAIESWGFDSIKNGIFQLDLENARLHPEQIYAHSAEMADRVGTRVIGIETTSLNEFITYPFNNFLLSKGFPPAVELKAKAKKNERIAQLAPLYRMGSIWHHPDKRIHGPLEAQLMAFPRGKHVDCADCAAYLLEMFHIGSRFFSLPENEDTEAMAKELAAMDAMENEHSPLPGRWRWAP